VYVRRGTQERELFAAIAKSQPQLEWMLVGAVGAVGLLDMTAFPIDARQVATLRDAASDTEMVPIDFIAKSGKLIVSSIAVVST
jgi:hypothetical protein